MDLGCRGSEVKCSLIVVTANGRELNMNRYESITTKAQREIDRVTFYYKLAARLLTTLFVLGAGLFAYFSYKNVNDARTEGRQEIDRLKDEMKQQSALDAEKVRFNLDKEVFLVEQEVRNRIRTEFDRENIRALVENTAGEKIRLYTDSIIRMRVSDQVQPIVVQNKENLSVMEARISNIRVSLESLNDSIKASLGSLNDSLAMNLILNDDLKADFAKTKKELDKLLNGFKRTLDSLSK